jgi:hypothetical protein
MKESYTQVFNQQLYAVINSIKAIDHHSHALPANYMDANETERPDPLGEEPFPYPIRLRVRNTEYIEAWQALYGYKYGDMVPEHAREALKAKLQIIQQLGEKYPEWILDQTGIQILFVNMPSLGLGQKSPRFRWVVQADGLISPFEKIYAMGVNISATSKPSTLQEYINKTIKAQLNTWKTAGAVAIKFGIAYQRSLDISDVPDEIANSIYTEFYKNGKIQENRAKMLQDYLFRVVSQLAGEVHLAVHIHTGIGADPYYNISGSNPLLLESMFNDSRLRHTNFVMLHGGWPFAREAGVMLIKPNVYADFSSQTFLRSTRALSEMLQAWLEWYPEKVFFGSDAYPDDTPLANWEEKLWLTTRSSRQALTQALTRMMLEGQITWERAEELAQMVLRDNAAGLYGIQLH